MNNDMLGSDPLARPPKMSEVLADRIRGHILGQGLKPGELFSSEADLISRFSVARGTVREALRVLESEGLISIRRGRAGGVEVREPDLAQLSRAATVWLAMRRTTMRELMDFRELLEPAIAGAAATSATIEERRELVQIATVPHGAEQVVAADLHDAIAVASHNDLYRLAMAMLQRAFTLQMVEEHLTTAEVEGTHKAHSRIVQAIVDGDSQKAERAMRQHLLQFRESLEASGRIDDVIVPRDAWLRQS